jgi:hypothetical protein
VAIAAGENHSLALKDNGTVVGWGYNGYGQASPPTGISNLVAIAAGSISSLALRNDGTVVSWGGDLYGQTIIPAGLSNVVAIASTASHNLALKNDGTVVAWGDNHSSETNVPSDLRGITAIAAGVFESMALAEDTAAPRPPTIWWQQPDRAVAEGQSTIFVPYVNGSSPLQFQWFFNGTPLAGETNRWLVLSSFQTEQAGGYQFVASNSYGSVTSLVMAVSTSLGIITEPANQSAHLGGNANFNAAVLGTEPLAFQWYFNGAPLVDDGRVSGSTTTNLNIANVQPIDAGAYQLIATNYYGTIASSLATLTIQINASNTLRFVNLNNPSPASPYTAWSTAATSIQDAIDVANDGDLVLVTNGVYSAGGRTVNGYSLTNRVVIDKAITVQSVNGPVVTVICGNSPVGANAVRCMYVTNGATVNGFTLTNGATLASGDLFNEISGGALHCESRKVVVTNCILYGNSASKQGFGGGAYEGTLNNCILIHNTGSNQGGGAFGSELDECTVSANWAAEGGGAGNALLNDCSVSNNFASYGGGAANSTLNNCKLVNNGGGSFGGGLENGTLNNCTLIGNSAQEGGGVDSGIVINNCVFSNNWADIGGAVSESKHVYGCVLVNNSASNSGGGATDSSNLHNCILSGNRAYKGGAADSSVTLNNCTLVGNSANYGGGSFSGTLNNCILFNNTDTNGVLNNWVGGYLANCCTTPQPPGNGNITNDPSFVDFANGDYHLLPNSPCINAGNNLFVTVTNDLDGNPRIAGGTVDIGAYEYPSPESVISYAWLQQYGLPTDGSVDYANLDGTGFNVYQDWIADLNPTNPASVLALQSPVATNNANGITVTWQSVNTRTYYLQRSSELAQPFSAIQSNLVGQAGTTSYTDTSATNSGPYFYRVGVQ